MAFPDVVEGWTGALDFILKADGTPVNLQSTNGDTATLILRTRDGAIVSTTGETTLLTTSTGGVRYSPSSNDFIAARSPYTARFKVIDGTGKVVFFPNQKAEVWVVHSA